VLDALGRIPARDIVSSLDLPSRPTAAMDGFAVRFGLRGDRLRFALVDPPRAASLRPGQACPVATGARVPRGTSAVARLEATRSDGGVLVLRTLLAAGRDIHRVGSALSRGDRIASQGLPIDAYALAALIAARQASVEVERRRVIVLPTGSELARPSPGRAPIDSIGPWLGAVAGTWAQCRQEAPVPDEPAELRRRLCRAARDADLVITIGGTSLGPRDLTKRAVAAEGTLRVGGTRVNVLKRAGIGEVGGTPVLLLPGQVESAVVAFHEFGLALLGRLVGRELRRFGRLRLDRTLAIDHRMDSTVLMRARDGWAEPLGWGVNRYRALLAADAFGYLRRARTYHRGERVRVQWLIRDPPRSRTAPESPPGDRRRAGPRPRRR